VLPRPTVGWLIAFRALQAVGGGMLTPVAMAVLTSVFTDRRERARAIGVRSTVQGITMALGPLLGGLLVDTAGWRWIFLTNLPVGILAPAPTGKVPESRAPHPRRPDAAITTTGRQIGSALGVAVIGATLPATTTFDHASRPVWWVITGCGITLAALAPLTRHRTRQSTTTRRSAEEAHPAPAASLQSEA
jgi:MFS family permease